jgi:tRNA1Val (adenine37-N6)-methyltransferase
MYSSETETLEQLKIGNLQFVQPKKGYRFSLDAILLANFISAKPAERLIDLGTGSGVIPLLVSVLTPVREIVGVELQERLMCFACRNVALNALEERIRIVQGNLKKISSYFRAGEFDLLCSNPPYRKLGDGRLNPDSEQAIARHEVECELEDLLAAATFLLKPGGKMFLIYLPERLGELLAGLQRYRLEAKRIRCIHSAKQTPASLVLVEAQRDASSGLTVLPPLFLYCRENVYSSEARTILHER